jgi:C4-dicarboxylate transporter DctQ subunit
VIKRGENLKKLVFFYNKFEEYLLVASIIFTVSIIFYQVVMRFVFNDAPSWTEELARYIFIWQIWMGASAGLKEGRHIRLDLVMNSSIKRNRLISKNILELLIYVFWIFTTIALTVFGILYVQDLALRNALSPAIRIPLALVYAALPVSCGVSTLRIGYLIFTETKKLLKGGAV